MNGKSRDESTLQYIFGGMLVCNTVSFFHTWRRRTLQRPENPVWRWSAELFCGLYNIGRRVIVSSASIPLFMANWNKVTVPLEIVTVVTGSISCCNLKNVMSGGSMQFRPEVRRSFVRGQEFICLPFLFLCMKLELPLHGVIIRSTTYLWLGYGSESEIFGRDPFPWICRYIHRDLSISFIGFSKSFGDEFCISIAG